MERVVRDRMTTQDVEAITPQTLINIRPVVAALKEFFGTSQLCQFMDQTNPIAGLTHKRRLSALGPGGLSRDRAGMEVRDVHTSPLRPDVPDRDPGRPEHRPDRLAGVASPGSTRSASSRRPYRKVVNGQVTDQIDYLTADEEDRYIIAQANAKLDDDGKFSEERVLVREASRRDRQGPRRRRRLHGRLAAPDGLGRDRDDPVPRARRRVPRPDGLEHAASGRPADPVRGAVRGHRHGVPRRGRRRRRDRRRPRPVWSPR